MFFKNRVRVKSGSESNEGTTDSTGSSHIRNKWLGLSLGEEKKMRKQKAKATFIRAVRWYCLRPEYSYVVLYVRTVPTYGVVLKLETVGTEIRSRVPTQTSLLRTNYRQWRVVYVRCTVPYWYLLLRTPYLCTPTYLHYSTSTSTYIPARQGTYDIRACSGWKK